jgi:hypothetical protein
MDVHRSAKCKSLSEFSEIALLLIGPWSQCSAGNFGRRDLQNVSVLAGELQRERVYSKRTHLN